MTRTRLPHCPRSPLGWSLLGLVWLGACRPVGPAPRSPDGAPMPTPVAPAPRRAGVERELETALASPDPRLRSAAIEIVSVTRQLRFLPAVRRLLRDPAVPVRFAAALAVGDTRYMPAQHDLVQVCDETHEDLNVRLAAAYALGRLGFREYPPRYLTQISNPDPVVRANVALLIGKGGHREASAQLYWALQDSASSDRVLMQAADSLARLGDARIIEKLWTRLISSFVDDRIDGIRAMGHLGTRQALEAVQTLLDDPEPEVRLVAAEVLGRAGDPRGRDTVARILRGLTRSGTGLDPERRTRLEVMGAAAIAGTRATTLRRTLERYLGDDSPIVRLAAARALLELDGSRDPLR